MNADNSDGKDLKNSDNSDGKVPQNADNTDGNDLLNGDDNDGEDLQHVHNNDDEGLLNTDNGDGEDLQNDDGNLKFEQMYKCYPVSFIEKDHLEKGDKVIMPPSALHQLAYLDIDYPMLFELSNPSSGDVTHCGVLEFTADEGTIFLPDWMMPRMLIKEGDDVLIKYTNLSKGTYVKIQPHTTDFLNISNPKAVLERTLSSYSCLTTGGTVVIDYNEKKFYIDILETKPAPAVCIIDTDCEVEFAPPLDYKEPAKSTNTRPEGDEEPEKKKPKFGPFTGSARRLDGKPPTQLVEPVKQHEPKSGVGTNGSTTSSPTKQRLGTLVFGSNATDASNGKQKTLSKGSNQDSAQKEEEKKFVAFSGNKYMLNDNADLANPMP